MSEMPPKPPNDSKNESTTTSASGSPWPLLLELLPEFLAEFPLVEIPRNSHHNASSKFAACRNATGTTGTHRRHRGIRAGRRSAPFVRKARRNATDSSDRGATRPTTGDHVAESVVAETTGQPTPRDVSDATVAKHLGREQPAPIR